MIDENSDKAAGTTIRLLGGLELRVDGVDMTAAVGGRVSQLALSFLVLNRERAVRRDELAAAVWERNAPVDVDGALRVAISRLRRAIGSERLQGRAELRLALADPVSVDFERLHALVAAAEADDDLAAARAAVALSTGELLPALDADWLRPARERVLDLRIRALQALGSCSLRRGGRELAGATEAGRQLVALAPYREGAHRLLIEALMAEGEPAEAMLAYHSLRSMLHKDLGTAPNAELASLHMQLLLGDDRADGSERPRSAGQLALPAAAVPAARPRLAGRVEELDELGQLWASGGDAFTLALLEGEPGVGKSRLAAEFVAGVHATGVNVLWGSCHDQALIPYEPFVAVLRDYVGSLEREQLAEVAQIAGAEFLSLAPDMERRLSAVPSLASADDPQARRYRLFESVAEALSLAAARDGLVVVLEDIHWADRSTLLLLGHLARRGTRGRALVLATLRHEEVRDIGAVAVVQDPAVAAWTFRLGGLTAAQTGELVAELAPRQGLGEGIYDETSGNPLFVVEMVRARLDEGRERRLPSRVVEVIDRRLTRVSPDSSTMLGSGAVLGRTFSLATVARMSGLPYPRLLDAVDELIAAGLLEETPAHAGEVSFTHALVREARYSQHSDARRNALHGAAAEALETLHKDDLDAHLGELATHWEAAVVDRASARSAVAALGRAGAQARRRQAFEDDVALLRRACELFELASARDSERLGVLLPLAESLRASDKVHEARIRATEALALAVAVGDPQHIARAALCFVGSHLVFKAGRPDGEDIATLEAAIAALGDRAPSERVRLLTRLCSAIYYSERFDEVGELSELALRLASGDAVEDEALGWAHYARFWAALRPEGVGEAAEAVEQVASIAARVGTLELGTESMLVEWYSLLQRGRPDLVATQLAERRDAVHATGVPIYRWFVEAIAAMLAVVQGRGEDAERAIAEVMASGAAIDAWDLPRFGAIPLVQLRRDQGRESELVDPLRHVVENNPGLPLWKSILLQALVGTGEIEEAQALLEVLAREDFSWLRRDVNWPWAMAAASESCVALGCRPAAEILYGLISPLPEQSVVAGPALGFHGPLDRYLGLLAGLLGRPEEAERHFTAALRLLDIGGVPALAAATRLDRARALSLAGISRESRTCAGEALTAAEEMGLVRVRDGARALLGA